MIGSEMSGVFVRNAEFGRAIRSEWALADDATFLNHGSFGACPRRVADAYRALQSCMEAAPDQFFEGRIMPNSEQTELRSTIDQVAKFVGTTGSRCALVENATVGIQTVLDSLELQRNDVILLTDHQYPAVRLAAERRCRQAGASLRVVNIPFGSEAKEILELIVCAATGSVKLAIIDHITSATAMLFPVADIARSLREKGIPTLVDGAHAIGQLDLDIEAIDASWYVTNAHKWLYACRGTGILHASHDVSPLTRPLVASHFIDRGFPQAFDYVGTRDYCSWLALPDAIAFFEGLGPSSLRDYMARSVVEATKHLSAIGATPVSPGPTVLAMKAFVLPQSRSIVPEDAAQLKADLWSKARIQVGTTAFFWAALNTRFSPSLCRQRGLSRAGHSAGSNRLAGTTVVQRKLDLGQLIALPVRYDRDGLVVQVHWSRCILRA